MPPQSPRQRERAPVVRLVFPHAARCALTQHPNTPARLSATHASFALAELLRFSSASHLLDTIPQELQDHHRVKERVAPAVVDLKPATLGRARKLLVKGPEKQAAKAINIWDGWDDAGPSGTGGMEESEDELDLDEFGL